MNKLLMLIALTPLICEASNIEIRLESRGNTGYGELQVLQLDAKSLRFNGNKIDTLAMPVLLNSVQSLARIKSSGIRGCFAGTFTHTVKAKGKVQKEQGCLESDRAKELYAQLGQFKRLASQFPTDK